MCRPRCLLLPKRYRGRKIRPGVHQANTLPGLRLGWDTAGFPVVPHRAFVVRPGSQTVNAQNSPGVLGVQRPCCVGWLSTPGHMRKMISYDLQRIYTLVFVGRCPRNHAAPGFPSKTIGAAAKNGWWTGRAWTEDSGEHKTVAAEKTAGMVEEVAVPAAFYRRSNHTGMWVDFYVLKSIKLYKNAHLFETLLKYNWFLKTNSMLKQRNRVIQFLWKFLVRRLYSYGSPFPPQI